MFDSWSDFWADKALLNHKVETINYHNIAVGRIMEDCTEKALFNLSQLFNLNYVRNKINGNGADARTYGLLSAEIEVKNPQAKYKLSSSSIESDYLSRFNYSTVSKSRKHILITSWLIASEESRKKLEHVHIIETGTSLDETSSQEQKDFVSAIIEAELTRVLLQLESDTKECTSNVFYVCSESELCGVVDYSSIYLREFSECFLYNS